MQVAGVGILVPYDATSELEELRSYLQGRPLP